MYNFIQNQKIWFTISTILFVIGLVALAIWGLKLGIDFTGGSLIELNFIQIRPTNDQIQESLADLKLDTLNVQPTGDKGLLIRTVSLSEEMHQQVLGNINKFFTKETASTTNNTETQNPDKKTKTVPASALGITGEGTENLNVEVSGNNLEGLLGSAETEKTPDKNFEELRFDSIGPTMGNELKQKAFLAIFIVLIAIISYIAYAFRKISYPVESWKYGLSAIIALVHDILIVTGIYAILGHYLNYQVDALFITALLTILGFSVHDTIVTFDRIRENLHRHQDQTFETIVNNSINETIVRSLNTTLTTFFVLLTIFLFGGETIKNFALTLLMGVVIGTYSSIFVASPLLVIFYRIKKL